MRVSYKIMGLIPMFGLVCGCSLHRGVITYIDDKKVVVKDIDLGTNKTIFRDIAKVVPSSSKYVHTGDTLYIESTEYNKDTLHTGDKTRLKINCALIKSRQAADTIALVKQDIQQQIYKAKEEILSGVTEVTR